jgi:predicted site-specific integrase-resolvase
MSDDLKIQETHRRRRACVYIRQSSATQVLVNRESTDRQYPLRERAVQLGWPKAQIKVVDEDLAQTGSGVVLRTGFAQMTNEVAMGQVGIILCLEASRVARNNAEWYRLLDLCAVTELDVLWRVPRVAPIRTAEDTIELIRRLAVHHSDAITAGVLNRQGKKTATGESFTATRVAGVRQHWKIPGYQPPATPPEGELLTVQAAADRLGVAPSTLLRWIGDGFIGGEQVTPGAPWRVRLTQQLKDLVVPQAPPGYVSMLEAMRLLGVSRQTVMQRVKRGELRVVHVSCGKQKGLRIRVVDQQPQLFDQPSTAQV